MRECWRSKNRRVLNLRYVITGTNRNATWRSAVLDLIKYLSVIWPCSQTQQCSNTRLQLQSHQSVNLPESRGQGKLQFQNLKKKKNRDEKIWQPCCSFDRSKFLFTVFSLVNLFYSFARTLYSLCLKPGMFNYRPGATSGPRTFHIRPMLVAVVAPDPVNQW